MANITKRTFSATASSATLFLLCLQVALYTSLFLEGNFGRGSIVFTFVVVVGSMLFPFLLVYTLFYVFKQAPTRREDLAIFVPIVVLISSTILFGLGMMKLFLDELHKDAMWDIVPEFNTQDHFHTWSLVALYTISTFLGFLVFQRHVDLMNEAVSPSESKFGIILFLVFQIAINIVYFLIALEVLAAENPCVVCVGCAERISHEIQCNQNVTQAMCEDAGFDWCSTHEEGGSFTTPFVVSYGFVSLALGMVFFLTMIHVFGDSNLKMIENHHHWALLPIAVIFLNTLVAGSGIIRVLFRVLDVQPMRDVFPLFPSFRLGLFYAIISIFVLHAPICFYLMVVHMNHHKERCERQRTRSGSRRPTLEQ